jgi:hypothetical protein
MHMQALLHTPVSTTASQPPPNRREPAAPLHTSSPEAVPLDRLGGHPQPRPDAVLVVPHLVGEVDEVDQVDEVDEVRDGFESDGGGGGRGKQAMEGRRRQGGGRRGSHQRQRPHPTTEHNRRARTCLA